MTEAEAYQFENWQLKLSLYVDIFCISALQFASATVAKIKILGFNLSLIAARYRDKRDDGRYDDSEIIIVTHRRKRAAARCVFFSFLFLETADIVQLYFTRQTTSLSYRH